MVLQVARALWTWFRPAAVTAAALHVYTAGAVCACGVVAQCQTRLLEKSGVQLVAATEKDVSGCLSVKSG